MLGDLHAAPPDFTHHLVTQTEEVHGSQAEPY
jgi:hypothetical protein